MHLKTQYNDSWPELRIVHLYPDLLNLYGDIGNIISLSQRGMRRGLRTKIVSKSVGDVLQAEDFDILFIGGGQDSQQSVVQADLLRTKSDAIHRAADDGKVILAICGGYQLLGKRVGLQNGTEMEGLGVIDVETRVGQGRLIGDTLYQADFLASDLKTEISSPSDPRLLFGFENHGSRTYLGAGVKPLAKVLHGKGNNSEDGFEGAHWKHVFCTYSHGSFLPKNPVMTDHLLQLAMRRYLGEDFVLPDLDRAYEQEARRMMWKRLKES